MSRRLPAILLVVAVLAGTGIFFLNRLNADPSPAQDLSAAPRTFDSNDWLQRACALPKDELVRLWRGHHPVHSEDVTIVPLAPNYSGSFGVTSHSGPWDYLQNVPLVLYGPGNIRPAGVLDEYAAVIDIYPTVGALTGIELPRREGRELRVVEGGASPKLIVTLVWDGVGRNVLARWPDRWPHLARLEQQGASFLRASVGSSPSITPATHASMGTGVFPVDHGVTAIEFRDEDGTVRGVFGNRDPSDLEVSTFGDEVDRALGNEPIVGMLAWKSWHMGMLGHGSALPGGDADQLALIGSDHRITGNPDFYSTPGYLEEFPGLEDRAEELDRLDGQADGKWRGHEVLEQHDNPAWVEWQTDAVIEMLDREGYGTDEAVDLFFINYKPTDIVAHQHNMDSPEMGDTLEAQDAALGRLVEFLDRKVKDYVIVLTSDHGNTPPPTRSGAWPVLQGQLQEDIDAHFEAPEGKSLVRKTSAAGPFLNHQVARHLGVDAADVAEFLNSYRLRDNYGEPELPEDYRDRGDENILAAAFPSDGVERVMKCAFGTPRPPQDVEA
ncbi:MAG: alkaline phosphatase family protein [Actinomycetota bacterium]|nr:alkaline phosphatase family protein [Actinomycetota bacterium]